MAANGFLTREIKRNAKNFPLDDWSVHLKRTCIRAITAAWSQLQGKAGDDLPNEDSDGYEPRITANIAHCLNEFRNSDRHASNFHKTIFQEVVTESSTTTYDGKSVDKRQDLVIRLLSRAGPPSIAGYGALVIECKVISPNKGVSLYCKDGLIRFVQGDYAWAMPSAMMLAYVRGSYSVQETLQPFLQKDHAERNILKTLRLPHAAQKMGDDVYASKHDRPWKFPETNHSPGPITLLHLWLNSDE